MPDEQSMGGTPPRMQDETVASQPNTEAGANVAPAPAQAAQWARIPAALRERAQWCYTWPGDSDLTKRKAPRKAGTSFPLASSTDPATWMPFELACQWAQHADGNVGYVLTADDPLACIDFDVEDAESQQAKGKPVDPSKWTTQEEMDAFWAMAQHLDSYTEASQSGKGLHIFIGGKIGKGIKRQHVEFYSQERFIICTGHVVLDRPIQERQEWLNGIAAQFRTDDRPTAAALVETEPVESDEVVLGKARATSEKFDALWKGEWEGKPEYPSQSEADLALMGMLAVATPSNAQAKRLFRVSGLAKTLGRKSNQEDYLNRTLRRVRIPADIQKLMDAFGADGLAEWYAQHGPHMDLRTMLKELVYVAADKEVVAFIDNPIVHRAPTIIGRLLAHNKTEVRTGKIGKDGKELVESVPTFAIWMGHREKRVAYGLTFDPAAGKFCKVNDVEYLNLWRPIPHEAPPDDWEQRIQPFLEHAAYLVPVEFEREWLLDWLAHIQQKPGELPHHGFLMITETQGIGRNLFAEWLDRVWPDYVALNFKLVQAMNKGYNGLLSRKLLMVVDEINEGGKSERWEHGETLKSLIPEGYRTINVKYGLEYKEKNCCRLLMFSNWITAIPVDDNDRRLNIIFNPTKPQDAAYYKKLYDLRNDPLFIASIREYLTRRNITKFNPGERAMMNIAKQEVIAASRSLYDERMAELIKTWPTDLIYAQNLFHQIFGHEPIEGTSDTAKGWAKLKPIAEKAKVKKLKTFVLDGYRYQVWALRNPQAWLQADSQQIVTGLSHPTVSP